MFWEWNGVGAGLEKAKKANFRIWGLKRPKSQFQGKTHTLPRQLPKTPQKVFKPHWVSCGAKADNVRIPCALKPSPSPSPPVRPQHLQPQPQAQQVQATPPQPPARATSPQPSRAQPSPAKKCSPAQPSPAPLPASKPKHGFKKKIFGQNFRSKRYWHPNP